MKKLSKSKILKINNLLNDIKEEVEASANRRFKGKNRIAQAKAAKKFLIYLDAYKSSEVEAMSDGYAIGLAELIQELRQDIFHK